MRCLVLGGVCILAGCPIDRFNHYDRPAHAELGFNTRHFSSVPPAVKAREVGSSSTKPVDGTAATVALRFTMRTRWATYMGGEAEVGTLLGHDGSNVGGAYAVVGAGAPFRPGTLSAEIAGGWRGVRDSINAPDYDRVVIEPRLRGELWLSPKLTLGAAAGAELTSAHSWMAGIYLGIHSHEFGRDPPAP